MYRTSVPASAFAFHDRREAIARLLELVGRLSEGSPSWLAILGPRKIGKTSLLLETARRAASPTVAFVLLDTFEDLPVSADFFRRYALRVLDAVFASDVGASVEALAPRPGELRAALVGSARFASLPADLRATLIELPDRSIDASYIQTALELPERLAQALGLHVIVAIDEFQELAGLDARRGLPDPLPAMRAAWQRHQRVAYVISGSARDMLTELVMARHSPFFQHFALMELGPFSNADAIELLASEAPPLRPVPPNVAARAVQTLGGHPFYLQLFGEALTEGDPPYDDGAFKDALQRLLFSRTGRLALYFENEFQRIVGKSTALVASLVAIATGPTRLTDVASAIGAPSGSAVRYLERLGDAVVRDPDGRYRLDDPVFGLWLRWRQPGGTVVPMWTLGDDAERLVADHLARMGFDLVYSSCASRGAFDLMATRGGAQLGVQVKRTKLPVRLPKAEFGRILAESRRFGWRAIVAAVTPDDGVHMLDPAEARVGKEVRLDEPIPNVLAWMDALRG